MKSDFNSSTADRRDRRGQIAIVILVIALVALLIVGAQSKNRAGGIASPSVTLTPNATLSPDQALDAANQAIARDPDDHAAYVQRAAIYAQQKLYDQAVADFSRAIQLNPTDAPSYLGRGMAYLSIAYQQKEAAQQEQIARQGVADLRTAQRLGYTLPSDVELAIGEIEGQLGRPTATASPES